MAVRAFVESIGPHRSIRRFALAGIVTVLCLLSIGQACLGYRRLAGEINRERDEALLHRAGDRLHDLRTSLAGGSSRADALQPLEPPGLMYRLSDDRGALLAGDPSLSPRLPGAAATAELYDDEWRTEPIRIALVRETAPASAGDRPMTMQLAEPYAERHALEAGVLREIIVATAAQWAVALAALWLIVRLALRPIDALRDEMRDRRGAASALRLSRRPDELAPLVEAFNDLQAAQQAALNQQRKFLAEASHQLRTPIAVLRTQLQGLMAGEVDAADTLAKMLRTIDRASGLTTQLLSAAKVEQLVHRGEWKNVSLDDLARDVALEFASLIARKQLDFSLECIPVAITTDPWLLGELMRNLLANAAHHSPRGAELGIVIRRLRDEIELIVWDRGGGLDETVMGRLFEPFSAAPGGTGIGLGLSICRQITDSMGASVELFNRFENGAVIGADAVVRWPSSVVGPVALEQPHFAVAGLDRARRAANW
jgi:two-component system, OmpR family, sensor histidine kinase TctE